MNLVEKLIGSFLSLGIPLIMVGVFALVVAPMQILAAAKEQGLRS